MIKVALCIPTCNRPEYLCNCLREINQIEINSDEYDIHVIVVDNGSIEKADRAFKQETAHFRFTCSYHTEERKGIPFVRNKCIDIARERHCQYLVFIDDDEYPDKMWLKNLLSFAVENNAEIVTGPVLSNLPATTHKKWINHCDIFNRIRHTHGSSVDIFATNNVLLQLDMLTISGLRFDESMNLCGGSDTDLSMRLRQTNRNIFWCDTAIVYENIPLSRCTLRWVFFRYFRHRTDRFYFRRKYGLPNEHCARHLFNGIVMTTEGIIAMLFSFGIIQSFIGYAVRKLGIGCGLISGCLGIQYQEYKKYHVKRSNG